MSFYYEMKLYGFSRLSSVLFIALFNAELYFYSFFYARSRGFATSLAALKFEILCFGISFFYSITDYETAFFISKLSLAGLLAVLVAGTTLKFPFTPLISFISAS
jgi:hypothetical protein